MTTYSYAMKDVYSTQGINVTMNVINQSAFQRDFLVMVS